MMPAIRLLDESIAQKIAAGEVVERPASVVKELLENAIDAGSTFVTVEIREGGVEHIRVTDNGCGIPAAEVELAFLRHATSKIQTLEDLYRISQMGFRGEALYSIAAVSRLELTTKPLKQPFGVRLTVHGGRRVSMSEFGCPDGTTIIAGDLFYNTPARLKFLNKPAMEAAFVSAIVTRHILANPGISIKFINNGRIYYHSAGDGSLRNAIYTIYGKEVAQRLIPVDQQAGQTSVSGFLFAAADAGGNRSRQSLLINGRPVNNAAVSAIVERVVSGLSDGRRFPGYVLDLRLPPADVDVNVHPNKLQVRFSDEHQVKLLIESAVSRAVENVSGQPILWTFPNKQDPESSGSDRSGADTPMSGMVSEARQPETIAESVDRLKESIRAAMGGSVSQTAIAAPSQLSLMQRPSVPSVAMPDEHTDQGQVEENKLPVRIIGQAFDTYALLEFGDKLLIVDQHAAHERLLYERYRERLRKAEAISQPLLIPQIVDLPHESKALLDENMTLLGSMGFELEEYGKLSYRVRAVPFILGQPQVRDFLFELLENLSDDRALRTEELKKERMLSLACRKAVKAGDRLSAAELAALAGIIAAEDTPLTCPHGRPFVVVLDKRSLERQFKRVK